jgi:L-ascorbate metabolism protein UlaG (beta-lactamase superfamily)
MKALRNDGRRHESVGADETGAPKSPRSHGLVILTVLLIFGFTRAPVLQADNQKEPTPATAGLSTSAESEPVVITYLANEGFLLEKGDRQVLIDALFGDGLRGYPTIPEPLRDEVENGRGRFSGIDCVLATHFHGDHFNPWIVERFLYRVPAQLISTDQAVEDLFTSHVDSREGPAPIGLRPKRHEIQPVDCAGVRVSAMSFHHGRLMVRNLAFLIDFDGFTILHVGDTEITADEIRPWHLDGLDIDVALLPAWHLTEASWTPVIEEIGARHIVAMHLASPDAPASWFGSTGSLENRIAEIRRQVPAAWIPTTALEERVFEAERRN